MNRRSNILSAAVGLMIGVVLMAVLPASASNGDNMIIGDKNNAQRATKLTSKGGLFLKTGKVGNPGLTIEVLPGTPPMQVNSDTRVVSLNADLLDGYHADQFANAGIIEPFIVEVPETGSFPLHDGGVFDVEILCGAMGTDPDHRAKVQVTSSVAWYYNNSVEQPAGSADIILTLVSGGGGPYVIWSDYTPDMLIIDVPFISAVTTGADCTAAGTLVVLGGS